MGADRELQRSASLWEPRFGEDEQCIADLSGAGTDETAADGLQEAYVGGPPAAIARKPEAMPMAKKLIHGGLTPQQILLRDKIGFVAGIVNIALSAWWIGKHPETFHNFYLVKAAALFVLRYVIYKSKGHHYFMLEMCYAANIALLVYLYAFPSSPWLYKAVFGWIAGPLTWSIVALRNSLVLHSLDQMTSLFLHASPAMVIYALRWYPSNCILDLASMPTARAQQFQEASFGQLVGSSMALYLIWAVLYYLKVFVISAQRIRERNYQTLFTLMTANEKSPVARVVKAAPRPLQPVVYMSTHALLCLAAASTAWVWFHSFWAHTFFIISMLLGAAWNGSHYYFEIFSRKYLSKTGLAADTKAE